MASKNPTEEIAAKILLDKGYDPCKKFPDNSTFWKNNVGCDAGFIPDKNGGHCYMLLQCKENFQDGDNYCKNYFDAELLSFGGNLEVEGFIKLFSKGINNFHLS